MHSQVAVSCLFVSVIWCGGAASAAAAQDTTVRLEGDGRLGPAADEYRGTSAAYGYEGTPGDQGKFTLTLRRALGEDRWLIFSDMDNASRPPQRPGAGPPP